MEIFRALCFYSKDITEKRTKRQFNHILLSPRVEEDWLQWTKNDVKFLIANLTEINDYKKLLNKDKNIYTIVTLTLKVNNNWELIRFDC